MKEFNSAPYARLASFPPYPAAAQQDIDGVTTEPYGIKAQPKWSDYARVYDIVLCRTATYKTMLWDLLGKSGPLSAMCDGRVVLDLGCGTGNLSREILAAYPNTTLIAIDNDESFCRQTEKRPNSSGLAVEVESHRYCFKRSTLKRGSNKTTFSTHCKSFKNPQLASKSSLVFNALSSVLYKRTHAFSPSRKAYSNNFFGLYGPPRYKERTVEAFSFSLC